MSLGRVPSIVPSDSPNSQVAPVAGAGIGRTGVGWIVPARDAGGVMTVPLIGIVTDRKAASYGAWVDIPTDAISRCSLAQC